MKKSVWGRGKQSIGVARALKDMKKETDPQARDRARNLLVARMGEMRGLPQKLGQSLSLFGDQEQAEAFKSLTDNGVAMDLNRVTQILEQQWGKPIDQILAHLDPEPRAASLGQVHRAQLQDQTWVAVKVAYPGIREAVSADLKLLGWASKPAEFFIKGFRFDAYDRVLQDDLEQELDYRLEAQNQKDYAARVNASDHIVVPQVIDALSTDQVLVTTWEDGDTLEETRSWPQPQRQRLGSLLVTHFQRMFFEHGIIHADPHRGNYRFRRRGDRIDIVLYDYGSVARFDKQTRLALAGLIQSIQQQRGNPLPFLIAIGFKRDLLLPLKDKLPALCRVLFDPFLHDGPYDHGQWHSRERCADILADDTWNFRMSGPATMVFLVRGFQGIFHYLRQWQVIIPWKQKFSAVFQRIAVDVLSLNLPPEPEQVRLEHMARYLSIRYVRDGAVKVSLKLPMDAVERLDQVMGEDVLERVTEAGICLKQVAQTARKQGYQPGDLFRLDEDNKTILVALA